jgi:hypothetical protein
MAKKFDREIFKEMILFISAQCKNKPTYGSTILNKILYYSDFFWYGMYGDSISGETYVRRDYGAAPKHLLSARDSLKKKGILDMIEVDYHGNLQKRPVVTGSVNYKKLTKEQMEHINKIISEIDDYTAKDVSEKIAHRDLPWNYLKDGDEIPYETVFFLRPTKKTDLTKQDFEWAEKVIDEFEESLKGNNN